MLRAEILTDIAAVRSIVPEWRALLARSANPQPVQTPLWLVTWWLEFGESDGRSLRFVTLRDGGTLVGVVPLAARRMLHRGVLPLRRLELLATGENEEDEICSDYVGAVLELGREVDVANALAKLLMEGALGGWDELHLTQMRDGDPLLAPLEAALARLRARPRVTASGLCPYVPLPRTWDEYTKALDGEQRYAVSRGMRELEKWAGRGNYELRRAETRADLEEGRRILHSLHAERWSTNGAGGVFASARFRRFHDEVMPRLFDGEDGGLDLMWLSVRNEPIACVYNIIYGNKVHFYQSGRKLEVPKAVKPGMAIHSLAIRRSIELGHSEYDFLNGASQYKRKLATATRSLVTLTATAPELRARAVDAARTLTETALAKARHLAGGLRRA
ncbi:MAG TPA: GNAT family N-acetyltransferase [Polyangiaceae bacterium]|nr:GNAT family N-acetyltransferase [Polyangiaceae bacterium]